MTAVGVWAEIAEAQPPLLALLLVVAGAAKLLPVVRGSGDAPVGVLALVPRRHRQVVSTGLAAVELALGAALVGAPASLARPAVTALLVGAVPVVAYLWRRKPEAGCGCFGELSGGRVGVRAVVRTGLLAVLSAIALGGHDPVPVVLADFTAVQVVAVAVEVAVLAALSPELARLRTALRGRSVPCAYRQVPAAHALAKLHAGGQWRRHRELLTATEPLDQWRDLCWQVFAYPGRRAGQDVEVVFAVHLDGRRPEVRVAVVAAADTGEPVAA